MEEQALRDRKDRHREYRPEDAEGMLPGDEDEDHQHRVESGSIAEDLGIEEVSLELVDRDDPGEHQQSQSETLWQRYEHHGDRADDGAKDRDDGKGARHQGQQ